MANGPLKIGVTGGIGSGKSTVCKVFACLGIPVYDADSRAKAIMNEDPLLQKEIITTFGEQSYVNGIVNREYLGKLVFPDPEKVAKLNQLVHPAMGRDLENWVDQFPSFPYVIKESALFIEAGSYKQLDQLILVTAPEDIRIRRVLQRDTHRTEQDVRNVIQRQIPDEEKRKFCQLVIENDGIQPVLPILLAFDAQLRGK